MFEVNLSTGSTQGRIYTDISVNCFLNAFIRESKTVTWRNYDDKVRAVVAINHGEQLIQITLKYKSLLGIHEFTLPIKLISQSTETDISFDQFLQLILNDQELVGQLTGEQKQIFVQRVKESRLNTLSAIKNHENINGIFNGELNFTQAEQALIAGHSMHPAPKSREQFSEEDARLYSPEYQAHFPLYWFAVSETITISGSAGDLSIKHRINQLLVADSELASIVREKIPDSYLLLAVHPWQAQLLLKREDIQQYQQQGLLINLGVHGADWYPTSSTRSLYSPNLPYMLKFSLSVKLTNSIRNLSLKEVVRGTRLQGVFDTDEVNQFIDGYPTFKVMQESAFIGLIDNTGKVIDESLVVFRENLLMDIPQEESVVLATLNQQHPFGKDTLVAERVKSVAINNNLSVNEAAHYWFKEYCQHVIKPLFALQANLGIVFLAHQQNIVLKMCKGLPVGMYYRDCQGTGYTNLAFQLFPDQLSGNEGQLENYWDEDKVKRYFPYYLIINSTYNTIAAICARCDTQEAELIKVLKDCLTTLKAEGVKDSFCLDYVLQSKALCSKGNFFCYLQNYNENSISDPAVIYFDLKNPLVDVDSLIKNDSQLSSVLKKEAVYHA